MIRWVFFDVGNVLLDEDPLTYRNFCRHVEAIREVRPDRSFGNLLAEREARAVAGARWPLFEMASAYLGPVGCASVWEATAREVRASFDALSPPIAGAGALVERIGRRYRLGLIANQGAECRSRLEALGWLGHFEVVAFGEEQGVCKPDPSLFRSALDLAGVPAGGALMVGDRLDNDIAPAAALGMATAWIRWPRRAAKGWPAGHGVEWDNGDEDDDQALAYLASLERIALRAARGGARVTPTIALETLDGLAEALGCGPG
jgi:FMN phosphatase YigB (HAD superfamily)